MPHESFQGPDVPGLMARARATLGVNAVVLSVTRLAGGGFELVASDVADVPRPARAGRRDPGAKPPGRPRANDLILRSGPLASGGAARELPGGRLSTMRPLLSAYATPRRREPVVIALVGPTGAGKTTTIAKLASHPDVFGGVAVGLLCLDTYRIGAVEQLEIYAEIARVPLEVAYEARDLARAMRRLRDREVVLVDTAGRGPGAAQDLAETGARLAELAPAEVHLTIPAGLAPRHARGLVGRHAALGVTHLIATKLDEDPEDDTVFDLALESALPMRWATDGQEVPTDLRPASSVSDASLEAGRP